MQRVWMTFIEKFKFILALLSSQYKAKNIFLIGRLKNVSFPVRVEGYVAMSKNFSWF